MANLLDRVNNPMYRYRYKAFPSFYERKSPTKQEMLNEAIEEYQERMSEKDEPVSGGLFHYGASEGLYPKYIAAQKADYDDLVNDYVAEVNYLNRLDEIGRENREIAQFNAYSPSGRKVRGKNVTLKEPDYESIRKEKELRSHSIEELDPSTQPGFWERFIFGDYDPESELNPETTEETITDLAWGATPFWALTYGHELENDWKRGYKPGLLEAGLLAMPYGSKIYRDFARNRALKKALTVPNAAQQMAWQREAILKSRTLPLPEPNAKVLESGRFPWSRERLVDRYVDPNTEWADVEAIY